MRTIGVFVSHSLDDEGYEGGVSAFRKQVQRLVSEACAQLSAPNAGVTPNVVFQASQYGRPHLQEIRRQITECDFLIADISQSGDGAGPVDPNVMYEIGFAMALEKRAIVIRRQTKLDPPADIRDLLAGSYDNIGQIPERFADATVDAVTDALNNADLQQSRVESSLDRLWFPRDVREVTIVCTPDPEPGKFSKSDEPNYVHIDNFDDRDAVIELATFFARRYPRAKVERTLCSDLSQDALTGNLVVLGGPGCVADEGNEIGRDLMAMLKSVVTYPESGDGLVWETHPMRVTEFDDKGRVAVDWGSILAAPNPYNPSARIVLLHGTTTFGTLGAAIALNDSPTAMRNHLTLEGLNIGDRLTKRLNLEILIRTEVGPRLRPRPPTLDLDAIRIIAA